MPLEISADSSGRAAQPQSAPESARSRDDTLPEDQFDCVGKLAAQIRRNRRSEPWVAFLVLSAGLATAIGTCLLTFWPGFLGEDSLAVLLEIESHGGVQSQKPTLWFYFVKALYASSHRTELPIIVLAIITVIVFSRVLAWCCQQQLWKSFTFSLLFICVAPQVIFFTLNLYADGIFSVACTGLLFECWLALRRRHLTGLAIVMLFITVPFALFARGNGLALLPLLAFTAWRLPLRKGLWVAVIVAGWMAAIAGAGRGDGRLEHGAIFPLTLFETVNFLQPRIMSNWPGISPHVSPATINLLESKAPLETILHFYDRDYWDPLFYWNDGPRLSTMTTSERKLLINEFFRYNLWHNFPAFLASRVNVFFVSALAEGGPPDLNYSSYIISELHARTHFRPLKWDHLAGILGAIFHADFEYRGLLWTPFLGIFLLVLLARRGLHERDAGMLVISGCMLVQLFGIFLFSIAGEYRYLLPFAILPLALFPMIACTGPTFREVSSESRK
jgi:hypothetical protein